LSAPAGAIFAKLTGGEREPLQPVESSWPWSGAAAARAGYWLPWPPTARYPSSCRRT
jgi:hypothetical protein